MTANFQENKKRKMSKQMGKSFRDQLSKMKIPHKHIQSPLRNCKYPRTPSFSINDKEKENENDEVVTLSDIDEFLFENFRTLFQTEYEEAMSRRDGVKTMSYLLESESELPKYPPALENLRGSSRFFVPSGSSSSLITDEASSSSLSSTAVEETLERGDEEDDSVVGEEDSTIRPDDFIALLTYSPCPYDDFRTSMQEMVDARLEHNGKVDWDFMEELLFCYLDLNNKKSYRYILRAFVDLMVVLRENSCRVPSSRDGDV